MKRVYCAAFFACALTVAATAPAEAAFKVQSKVMTGADQQHIAPFIQVTTDSVDPVDISTLQINYYFYEDDYTTFIFQLPTSTNGTTAEVDLIDKTYTNKDSLSGAPKNANYLIRIQLPPTATTSASAPFAFSVSVGTTPVGNNPQHTFNQNDDWSFTGKTSFVNNPNIALLAGGSGTIWGSFPSNDRPTQLALAQQKIKHVIVIMQENRSFDNYFGQFPNPVGTGSVLRDFRGNFVAGVDGLANAPAGNRQAACNGKFYPPHQLTATHNTSGQAQVLWDLPHFMTNAKTTLGCTTPAPPSKVCSASGPLKVSDALLATSNKIGCTDGALSQTVGYYVGTASTDALFNYWTIAKNFLLQDEMFAPAPSWSKISHLFMVSGWSANCHTAPCAASTENYDGDPSANTVTPKFGWQDLTDLFFHHSPRITWNTFRGENWNYNCGNDAQGNEKCKTQPMNCLNKSTQPFDAWNPLPNFNTVIANGQTTNSQKFLSDFLTAVTASGDGAVPQVSWIVPAIAVSDHDSNPGQFDGSGAPFTDLKHGEAYVTMLLQQIMKNTALWNSSIVFLAWDDWGGYYDHVRPPTDGSGNLMYGNRVPAMAISPWLARGGVLDHTTLSFDAYLKFIEDLYLGGQRIGGGSADGRPSFRENEPILGDLLNEFDFNRKLIAPPSAVTGLSCNAP